MTKRMEVYKCDICGNIIEMLHIGKGELVCCGQPMKLLEEGTVDAVKEKHIPIVEVEGDEVTVKVGSVPHPMIEKHYIEWIEIVDEECGKIQRKYLKSGDKSEAHFHVCCDCKEHIYARAYCNIHGLWKS